MPSEEVRVRLKSDRTIVTRRAHRAPFRDAQLDSVSPIPESAEDAKRLEGGEIIGMPAVDRLPSGGLRSYGVSMPVVTVPRHLPPNR